MSGADPEPEPTPAPDPSIAVSLQRIAAALEDLASFAGALEHVLEREVRARRVFPPDEGSAT